MGIVRQENGSPADELFGQRYENHMSRDSHLNSRWWRTNAASTSHELQGGAPSDGRKQRREGVGLGQQRQSLP
jgi:hypothetical protein